MKDSYDSLRVGHAYYQHERTKTDIPPLTPRDYASTMTSHGRITPVQGTNVEESQQQDSRLVDPVFKNADSLLMSLKGLKSYVKTINNVNDSLIGTIQGQNSFARAASNLPSKTSTLSAHTSQRTKEFRHHEELQTHEDFNSKCNFLVHCEPNLFYCSGQRKRQTAKAAAVLS